MRRRIVTIAVLGVLIAVGLGLAPVLRTAWLATLVLIECSSPETDGPIARLRASPVVETVSFPFGDRRIVADLYRPSTSGPSPGIVLCHGVAAGGRSDYRLVNFADALSRAGYVALVPEFENLKRFRVRPTDIDEFVAAFEYLETVPSVDRERIGLFGLSYAGGLALLAAARPEIADRVHFCFCLGGYYDLRNVVTYMTTGAYRDGNAWAHLEPRNSGRWAFLLNSSDLIEHAGDRAVLERIARRKLDDPAAPIDELRGDLGPEGEKALALLTNTDPERSGALIDTMSPRVREYFEVLSPRARVARVRAHLILAHGRDDDLIPYTETLLVFEHATGAASVHCTLLESFEHVDLRLDGGRGPGETVATLREIARLISVTYDLMARGGLGAIRDNLTEPV